MDSRALRDLGGESDYPPASAPGGDPLIGTLVADRYRVARLLGQGSQASVYVAKHTLIKRLVALKVLSPAMAADQELVRRFLDEGQVAGTMGHPNIVESLDMGVVDDGRPFLVLEYLEGTTVAAELTRSRAFDVARACYVGAQIASALGAAHARGIVHRDLKPENVFLIDRDGHGDHVKVLDFGISKIENRTEGSRAGLVVGTPDYMAPEQVTHPESVDSRADVFALGAMLYEMLSGHPPLAAGEGEDVLEVVVRRTPAPLGRICPNLPTQLIQTVERAMHKDRAKRTQSIGEVRTALELFALPSAPSAAPAIEAAPISGFSRNAASSPVSSPSAPPSSRSFVTPPPSASLAALATTAENPIITEAPMSDRLPVSAETSRNAVLAAAEADRLTAQLAAIAAVSPSGGRSMTVPIIAGALGAAAAGVIVFLALRGNPNMQQATSSVAKVDPTTQAGNRQDTAGGMAAATPVGGTTAAATQAAAAGVAAPAALEHTTTASPRGTAKAHDATSAAALTAAARREREADKTTASDPLTSAAAEVATHSTAATTLAAAPVAAAAPEPAPMAPAPMAPAALAPKPGGVLPFGEGMSRPSMISGDEIQFTREAREAHISGVMIVRCTITTEGALQNCRIMKSVPMMDSTVLTALSQHRGSPVMYQGRPVSVEYTYTIRLKSPD